MNRIEYILFSYFVTGILVAWRMYANEKDTFLTRPVPVRVLTLILTVILWPIFWSWVMYNYTLIYKDKLRIYREMKRGILDAQKKVGVLRG